MNSVDPDQMLHSVSSNQGLHCLPLIQQPLDPSTGSLIKLFSLMNKCGKELTHFSQEPWPTKG